MKRNNRHTSNLFLAFFSRPLDTCGACGRVLARRVGSVHVQAAAQSLP